MRSLLVVPLVVFLLLADDVVLQGTARVQPIATPHNGALEKNGSSLTDTSRPHHANNRVQIVTSAPIQLKPVTIPNSPVTQTITNKIVILEESVPTTTESSTFPTTAVQSTTPMSTTTQTMPPTADLLRLISTSTTEAPKQWVHHQALPIITTTSDSELFLQQQTTVHRSSVSTTEVSQPTTLQHYRTTTTRRPSTTEASQPTTQQHYTTTTTRQHYTTTTTRRPSSTPSPPKLPKEHNMETRSGPENNKLQRCPRSEDIHPCECVEVATPSKPLDDTRAEYEVETIVFCKYIRNTQVLREALRGMQGHHLTYMVLDSVHLPPFPNDLFKNVGVGWMEVLNSTIQFQEKFFQCYERGCS